MSFGISGPMGKKASGGISIDPVPVVSGTITSSGAPISWDAIPGVSGATPYTIQYKKTVDSVWITAGSTAATTWSFAGLDPDADYDYEVNAQVLSGWGTGSFKTAVSTLPGLVRMSVVGGSQDFGASLNNNGGLFFNPGGGAVTFSAQVLNQESAPITDVDFLLANVQDAASPFIQNGVRDGSGTWLQNRSIPALAAGGTTAAPTLAYSPKFTMGTNVAGGARFVIQHVSGAGWITAGKNLNSSAYPNGLVNADGVIPGDSGGTWPTYTVPGISPMMNHMFCYHDSSYAPKLLIGWIGDSLIAQVRAVAAAQNASKEGIFYLANNAARTAGKNIRFVPYGQGGETWAQHKTRVTQNLPLMVGRIGAVAVQVFTYNSPFGSAGDAMIRWNDWLTVKAQIEAAGLVAIPVIVAPPGARNSAISLSEFLIIQSQVVSNGGLDFSSYIATGTDITAAYSEDNVHINATGAAVQAPYIYANTYAWAVAKGWGI